MALGDNIKPGIWDSVTSLFRRPRRIEDPSTPITPERIRESMGIAVNGANFNVTLNDALCLPIVAACRRVIAETIAGLPLVVYRRDGESRRKAPDHPAYRILHDAPNEFQSPVTFWESVILRAIDAGNAYVYIERTNGGDPASLILLDDGKIKVGFNGTKTFAYGDDGPVPPQDIIHITGLSLAPPGLVGLPLDHVAAHAIALGLASEEYSMRFFTNGSAVGGTIEIPNGVTPEQFQQLKASWQEAHSGPSNQWKTAILAFGAKWNATTVSNDQAQLIELRKFQLLEVARIFRIPPHLVGDLDRATFSNIEEMGLQFLVCTLKPWLTKIEQELNRRLFVGSDCFAEYLLEDMLRGDINTRYQSYSTGRQGGWLSVNDIRRRENLPDIEGGDEYLSPLNMRPAGPGDNAAAPAPKQTGDSQ